MLVITFPVTVAVQILLASIVLALIGARLYLKFAIQRKRLEASDYLIFFSWICALAGTSGDIFMLILKVPDDTLATFENYVPSSPEHFELIFKYLFAVVFPLYTSFYLCKFALLAVYLQLFPRHMKGKRYALYATIAYTVACFIGSILGLVLSCLPVERQWTIKLEDACTNRTQVSDALWGLHITSSVMIYALPFLILRGMQLKRPVKLGLYATFGLSAIDLVLSSVMRFAWFRSDLDHQVMATIDLYYATDNYIFLIVACLPPLRPYLGMIHSSGSSARSWGRKKSTGAVSSSTGGSKVTDLLPRHSNHPRQPSQPLSPTAAMARVGSTDTLRGVESDEALDDYELDDVSRREVEANHV
ncbi:hypothetical protein MCOR02_007979 [Pyricularia oryzae]|uniref:Rhodopsin domain-containing protein n=1 Tax=Pyricularia oryzae TaxID=318829 RepID=A0A4P7NI22_PYROR|nr:hypothetical protein MCOR02_007979 [Pyricularia oryzae]QBZ61647.1 hypothetical protein PoMZ_08601 [Pyricularia oryzae]